MKRVLVTGATGFLGVQVVERLVEGDFEVTAHGNTRTPAHRDTITGDLASYDVAATLLGSWRWDAVVNLAGPVTSGNEDLRTGIDVIAAHSRIALHVRRFAGDARIVHTSSMTVYGDPGRVDVDETHPVRPRHLYGAAKLVAEDILLADPDLDAWVLRLPGLFSEQRKAGALYHFCRAARAGEPLKVTPVPIAWSALHVSDAALAVVRAVSAPGRSRLPINIAYGEPMDLVSIARLIAALGRGSTVEAVVEHPRFHLVTTRANQLLGWNPPTLRDRITRLYGDYAAA